MFNGIQPRKNIRKGTQIGRNPTMNIRANRRLINGTALLEMSKAFKHIKIQSTVC